MYGVSISGYMEVKTQRNPASFLKVLLRYNIHNDIALVCSPKNSHHERYSFLGADQ